MRRLLSFALAALTGLAAASSQAGEYGRRPVARHAVTALPPEMPYRDPRPRFRAPPPVARFAVRAYVPRPTNQPMFNEPPQPLR
ncbi:hypothetical protein [Methylorubrum thiocyanatum]|uniref:hypothetical protein n=1 Tax=Methylorubrum thiocyanatum TaxID=47958 RepID=UPI003F7D817A